jgi:ribonuclease BN (tRNA processing enzyme)
VWGPGGTEERIARAYHTEPGLSPDADTAHATDLRAAFDFRTLADRAPFELGGARFEPFLVRHPVECYALRVTTPDGGVVVYSGDTDECDGLDAASASADVLLCEAAFEEDRDTVRGVHLTGLRAGRTAQRAGVARLVLTHIPPWTREHIVRTEAESAYPGPIDVAAPGATWDIPNGRNPL